MKWPQVVLGGVFLFAGMALLIWRIRSLGKGMEKDSLRSGFYLLIGLIQIALGLGLLLVAFL